MIPWMTQNSAVSLLGTPCTHILSPLTSLHKRKKSGVGQFTAHAYFLGCETDVRAPDIRAPDIRAPDIRAPDVRAPDVRAPDVRAPDIRAPYHTVQEPRNTFCCRYIKKLSWSPKYMIQIKTPYEVNSITNQYINKGYAKLKEQYSLTCLAVVLCPFSSFILSYPEYL